MNLTANLRPACTAKDVFANISKPLKERFFDFESWRNRIFERHSNLSHMLSTGYFLAEKFNNLAEANKRLKSADTVLTLGNFKHGHINLSCSDDESIPTQPRRMEVATVRTRVNG